jgi:REP element-mobilizing transposase RayT
MPPSPEPLAHFLTWRTYGTWLPGDDRGWVSRDRNSYSEPMNWPDSHLANGSRARMVTAPVSLSDPMRERIDSILREACAHRGWALVALNVRTNHVHAVIALDGSPRSAMTQLKARTTRVLRDEGRLSPEGELWGRGGSARVIWNEAALAASVDYVLNRQ